MLRQVPHRVSTAHFGIIDIAAIAQRVVDTEVCGFGAGSLQQSAPGVMGVGDYGHAAFVGLLRHHIFKLTRHNNCPYSHLTEIQSESLESP